MKVLLLGANGQVGTEIKAIFSGPGDEVISLTRKECNLLDLKSIETVLEPFEVDCMINAAAYTAVDDAECYLEMAECINATALIPIVNVCNRKNIPLLHLSSDYVFDGSKCMPYEENDCPNPMNVYGRTKQSGERIIQENANKYLILRTSWVFGLHGNNFVKSILRLAYARDHLSIVHDQTGLPTAARDIARVIYEISCKFTRNNFSDWGIYHYGSHGATSWFDFARDFLKLAREQGEKLKLKNILPITSEQYQVKAVRPKYSVLSTEKIHKIFGIPQHGWRVYLPEIIESVANEQ